MYRRSLLLVLWMLLVDPTDVAAQAEAAAAPVVVLAEDLRLTQLAAGKWQLRCGGETASLERDLEVPFDWQLDPSWTLRRQALGVSHTVHLLSREAERSTWTMVFVGGQSICEDELLWLGRRAELGGDWLELSDLDGDAEQELLRRRRPRSSACGDAFDDLDTARYDPQSGRFESLARSQSEAQTQTLVAEPLGQSELDSGLGLLEVELLESVAKGRSLGAGALVDSSLSSTVVLEPGMGLQLRAVYPAQQLGLVVAKGRRLPSLEMRWEGGERRLEFERSSETGVYRVDWPAQVSCISLRALGSGELGELLLSTRFDGMGSDEMLSAILEEAMGASVETGLVLASLMARWPQEATAHLVQRSATASAEQLARTIRLSERLPWPQRGELLMALAPLPSLSEEAFEGLLQGLRTFPDAVAGATELRLAGLEVSSDAYLELAVRATGMGGRSPFRALLVGLERRSDDAPALELALLRVEQAACGFSEELLRWLDEPSLSDSARLALLRALNRHLRRSDCDAPAARAKVVAFLSDEGLSVRLLAMKLSARLGVDEALPSLRERYGVSTVDIEQAEALRALAVLGAADDLLLPALASEWPTVRLTAAELLSTQYGEGRWDELEQELVKAFEAEAWPELRQALFVGLSKSGSAQCEAIARAVLADSAGDVGLRILAAGSQAQWQRPLTEDELSDLVQAPSTGRLLRREVLRGAYAREDVGVALLFAWIEAEIGAQQHEEWRRDVFVLAVDLAALRARAALLDQLLSGVDARWSDESAMLVVVEALGRIDDERSRAALQRSQAHPSGAVREAAELALSKFEVGLEGWLEDW